MTAIGNLTMYQMRPVGSVPMRSSRNVLCVHFQTCLKVEPWRSLPLIPPEIKRSMHGLRVSSPFFPPSPIPRSILQDELMGCSSVPSTEFCQLGGRGKTLLQSCSVSTAHTICSSRQSLHPAFTSIELAQMLPF